MGNLLQARDVVAIGNLHRKHLEARPITVHQMSYRTVIEDRNCFLDVGRESSITGLVETTNDCDEPRQITPKSQRLLESVRILTKYLSSRDLRLEYLRQLYDAVLITITEDAV